MKRHLLVIRKDGTHKEYIGSEHKIKSIQKQIYNTNDFLYISPRLKPSQWPPNLPIQIKAVIKRFDYGSR